MIMPDCTVCIEKTRKNLLRTCNYCKESACVNCWQKYLTEAPYTNCMFCSMEFKESDMKSVLTIVKFKEVLNNIYLQQFKMWLQKPCKEYSFDTIKILTRKPKLVTRSNRYITEDDPLFKRLDKETKEEFLDDLEWIKNLEKITDRLTIRDKNVSFGLHLNKTSKKGNNSNIFIPKNCTVPECDGFLERSKCIKCNVVICTQCDKPNSENHQCNPDDIETKRYLSKNSKNCPSCHAVIIYVSGCSAMFCSSCETFFNWKTLQIYNRVVHNPEYSRYLEYNNIKSRDNITGELNIDADICRNKLYGTYIRHAAHLQYLQENITRTLEKCLYSLAEIHITQYIWPNKFKNNYDGYFKSWKNIHICNTQLMTLFNAMQKYCENSRKILSEAYDATKNIQEEQTNLELSLEYKAYYTVYNSMPKSIKNSFS